MQPPPKNFESVVDTYYRDLFRFAISLTNNEADAVDLTQSAFLKYATKGHTLRDLTKVKSWLFRTLKNEFIDQRRRANRFQHVEIDTTAETEQFTSSPPSPMSGIDTQSALDALQSLDEKFRIPLTLFYIEDLSYKEIATAMEIPTGTVMSRLARGKEHLRAAFSTPTTKKP